MELHVRLIEISRFGTQLVLVFNHHNKSYTTSPLTYGRLQITIATLREHMNYFREVSRSGRT